jgi:hypothetical protein
MMVIIRAFVGFILSMVGHFFFLCSLVFISTANRVDENVATTAFLRVIDCALDTYLKERGLEKEK